MGIEEKIMDIQSYFKTRLKRIKQEQIELTEKVDNKVATATEKEKFVENKGRISELENSIDVLESNLNE